MLGRKTLDFLIHVQIVREAAKIYCFLSGHWVDVGGGRGGKAVELPNDGQMSELWFMSIWS